MPHPTVTCRDTCPPARRRSSKPPGGSQSRPRRPMASDRMVKTELDAARALADFAQLALLESEHGRRRPPSGDCCSEDKSGFLLDLNQHASVLEEQGNEDVVEEIEKPPPEDRRISGEGDCPGGSQLPSAWHRGKHGVSEAEKEAKRLRRILANRESARQTIRRRQAFREELTRKADSLSKDNEIMKQEKELMLKEYQLLKDANRQLKHKIAERLKADVDSGPTRTLAAQDPPPSTTTTTSSQPVTQRLPFVQFAWPPLVAPVNILKTHRNFESATLGYEQGALCLPPYPWFYPIMHHQPVSPPVKLRPSDSDEVVHGRSQDSPTKANVQPSERGAQNNSRKDDNDLHPTPPPAAPLLGSSAQGQKSIGSQSLPNRMNLNCEDKMAVSRDREAVGKGESSTAAADARRRRRELTRLKRVNGWQRWRQCDV